MKSYVETIKQLTLVLTADEVLWLKQTIRDANWQDSLGLYEDYEPIRERTIREKFRLALNEFENLYE